MLRKLKKIIEKPNASKLVTDAVPVADNQHQSNGNNLITTPSIEEISTNTLEIIPTNGNSAPPSPNTAIMARGFNDSNNSLSPQLQNIQGQNVYQFSHCNSLHFGHVVINNSAHVTQHNLKSSEIPGYPAGGAQRTRKQKVKTRTIAGNSMKRMQ